MDLPHSKKIVPLLLSLLLIVLASFFPQVFSKQELQQFIDAVSREYSVTPTPISPTESVLPIGLYSVLRIVDGDTIVVRKDQQEHTVRLLGIDTPESVDPRRSVECFGREAAAFLERTIGGKAVSLENDPTQDTVDRYGRYLAYVFLDDGTHVNKLLVSEGYAFEYTYDTPYKFQTEFKEAQREAMEYKKGLWNETTCSGER